MVMIMMMMIIKFAILWWELAMSLKKLRGPKLCLFSKQSCLLRSAWPPAESTVTLKITHAEAWNFFCAIFRLTISDYSSQQKVDAQGELIRGKNSIFSRKRRTKGCFLLTHNLKSKKVSVRDKFLPDAQFAPPLWKMAPAMLGFTSQLASQQSSQS